MKGPSEGFTDLGFAQRIRPVNDRPVRLDGDYVLYWMVAARRPCFNFALDRAIAWARHLALPLVIFEPLRCDYPWASDRLHRFVLDGMAANVLAFATCPVTYYPYVETAPGEVRGLFGALASRAALVVTDEFPCFFLPQVIEAAGRRLAIKLEAIDGNGILPLAAADRAFTAAVHYRRFVQRELRTALKTLPVSEPFKGIQLPELGPLPGAVTERWPTVSAALLKGGASALAALPIDHGVPIVEMSGGWKAARSRLEAFVARDLTDYHDVHNHPDDQRTSRLSPYLHFGHIGVHEVFTAVMRHEKWSPGKLSAKATGLREGWWGVRAGPEAYLDQLITWRELGFNACAKRPDDYDKYASLPAWARDTLAGHVEDPRPYIYTREQFERAATHDPLWNAAQRELLQKGWYHNYMRMLWGKKILEWSATPQEALDTMTAIMNRWSLDGRDPNSYSGYMWTLGKFDRPWPEREVYGTVRSMSSVNTAKKVRVKNYLTTYSAQSGLDFGT